MDPLCCFEEVYGIIFKVTNGMYEYPIFKHLIQFSNLVDPVSGKLQKGPEMPPMPVINKQQQYGEESDEEAHEEEDKEGGSVQLEGGESDQGNPNPPQQPVSSQANPA